MLSLLSFYIKYISDNSNFDKLYCQLYSDNKFIEVTYIRINITKIFYSDTYRLWSGNTTGKKRKQKRTDSLGEESSKEGSDKGYR